MEAKTVLVVDDDAALRLLCRVNLELDGHRVVEAATVEAARDVLRREPVDVALLDVNVGRGNGLSLVPVLRALQPSPRVFLLSGDSRVSAADRASVDGVLPKPFGLDQLAATVR